MTGLCSVPGCGRIATGYARGRDHGSSAWRRICFCEECAVGVPEWALFHYLACVGEGTSRNLALMFALGQPPMSNTDREFLFGHCNGSQFENRPEHGDAYAQVAREQGVDTAGAVYLSGLAAYPGDPRAWVRGRGDAQKVCEDRGWDCDGAVTVKAAKKDHAPGPAVADDIVSDEVHKMLLDSPEPLKESIPDLKAKVLERRRPHWNE